MDPLVSVIVPAYNAERWISESLSSACAQTWDKLEIVVVDDGSIDRTREIARAFSDPRIKVVTQNHSGAAAARNRGIRESSGPLVQFLDADDLLSPEKIELQVRALASEPHGTVASCTWMRFSGSIATARDQHERVWKETDPVEWLVASLAGGGMMQPGAWLTPRVLIDAAGAWNETLSLHDDGEFFSRVLLRAQRNAFVHGAVAYYRDVETSLSRRRSRQAIESAFAVCRLREQHLLAVRDDVSARRALATQYGQFAYEFCNPAPDLCSQAIEAIRKLGEKPWTTVGGKLFRFAARAFGINTALRLRSLRAAT